MTIEARSGRRGPHDAWDCCALTNGAETRWQLRLIHEGLPEYPYSYHVNTSLWFATQGGTIATYHFVEIGAWDGDWEGTGLYTGFYTIRGTGNSNYAEAKLTTPYTLGDVATFDVTYQYSDTVRAQVVDETTGYIGYKLWGSAGGPYGEWQVGEEWGCPSSATISGTHAHYNYYRRATDGVWIHPESGSKETAPPNSNVGNLKWCVKPRTFDFWINASDPNCT